VNIRSWFFQRHSILNYLSIFLVFVILGISIRLIFGYYLDSVFNYCPNLSVSEIYFNYTASDIPRIHNSFSFILTNNYRANLTMLLLPFFIFGLLAILVGIIPKKVKEFPEFGFDNFNQIDRWFSFTKMMICLTAVIWGINSFDLFCNIKLLPMILFLAQFPHAILEIPTFLFSGCLAFIFTDEFESEVKNISELNLTQVFHLFCSIIKKFYLYVFFIFILILIAAIIETWITPFVFKNSAELFLGINTY